ncbi:DNA-binding protein [Streptomyces sp. NBC_00708]
MSKRVETVVLDSEELSAWTAQDRKLLAMLQVFHAMGADLVIGANTIVEVSHSRTNMPRLNGALSRAKVEPVTEQAAKAAAELLKGAGLHGDKYAIVPLRPVGPPGAHVALPALMPQRNRRSDPLQQRKHR